jgi:hypothetical protein
MKDTIFDDFALERTIKERFGVPIEIGSVITDRIPVSHTATATVFLSEKKQLYAYISAQSNMTIGDVKKFVSKMGLKGEVYVPPRNQPDYFDEAALAKFNAVFPGRAHVSSEDLIYYRTLVPYNPALIQIQEIPEGVIRQFDTDAQGDWRPNTRFTYRRIKTS